MLKLAFHNSFTYLYYVSYINHYLYNLHSYNIYKNPYTQIKYKIYDLEKENFNMFLHEVYDSIYRVYNLENINM